MIIPEQQRSQAFQKGAAARRAGRPLYCNPHQDHTTKDAKDWWQGWHSAEEGAEGPTDSSFSVLTSSGAGQIGRANGTFNPAIAVDVAEREAQRRRAKVTAADVVVIRQMRRDGAALEQIRERFPSMTIQGISHIVNRHSWTHVPDPVPDAQSKEATA